MDRIIRSRNDRSYVKWHHPIGVSNVKRGASLSIAETLKKTSIIERQKMIDDSPLYDEFAAGTPIESLDLLEYMDLSIQPLDFTDAAMLREVAKNQISQAYEKFSKEREQAGGSAAAPSAAAASPAGMAGT